MINEVSLKAVCLKYGVSSELVKSFISKGLFRYGDCDDYDFVFTPQDVAKLELALQLKDTGLSLDKIIPILQTKIICKQEDQDQVSKNKLFDSTFYYELFSNSPSFLIITDDKGNIIDMNQAVREKLGYGDEMIGKSLLELHPEDVRLEATENLYKILNGDLEYCPLDILSKDGRRVKVESRSVILEYEGQKLMLGISREKSISHEMDKMLEKRENLFRTLFQMNMSASMIISIGTRKILSVNRAFEYNTGYKSDEIIGKTLAELKIVDDLDNLVALKEEIIHKGYLTDVELVFRKKNGDRRVINFSATLIDYHEPSFLINGTDISSLKEYQHKLENTILEKEIEVDEMSELNQAIIEAMPDIVVLLDRSGMVYKVYDAQDSDTSFINDGDIDRKIYDIMSESASFIIKLAISETYREGFSYNNVFRHKVDGQKNWYSISLSKVNDVRDLVVGVIRDITTSVRHTLELEHSESRYRAIFNSKASAMLLINIDEGDILDANKAAEELFELSINQLKRMTFGDILSEGNIILRNIMNGNELTKDGEQFRTEIITNNKIVKHVDLYIGSLFINKQRKLIAIIHDITAQYKAETLLQEQKLRLQSVIDGSQVGLWDWNTQTGEMVAEGNFFGMIGYNKEELEPISIETWRSLCHPDDLVRSDNLIQKMLDGSTDDYECEVRMKHKSGEWVWVLDKGKIMEKDQTGKAIRLVGTHLDFTERKKSQQNLQKRIAIEELLNTILKDFIENDVLDTSEIIDRSLKQLGEFTDSDRCYLFTLDKDPDFMSNTNEWCAPGTEAQKDILQNLPVSVFPWWMEKLRKFEAIYVPDVAKMVPEAREEQKILQEQDLKSVVVIPVYSENKLIGFLGFDAVKDYAEWSESDIFLLENVSVMVANNLLKQKLLESLIVTKNIAEESNRIKSEFIANINHEVRTPLHTLNNFLKLLEISDIGPGIKRILPEITQSTYDLTSLLESILTMNNIEAGRMKLHKDKCNFSNILEHVIAIHKPKVEEKKLKIKLKMDRDKSWVIVIDSNHVMNILHALISNAIKYSDKGTIEILAELDRSEQPMLFVRVKDQGQGMNESQKNNVFETFYQSEKFLTKEACGFGLGLPIVKKLLDLMGGNIEVKSEENVGTEINLKMPISLPIEKQNILQKSRDGISVLLVEDNDIVVKMMKRLLEKNNFQTSIAKNGRLAVEASKEQKVDVILMDIQMPEMDGITASKLIKGDKDNPNNKTPIIALSAHLGSDELEYSEEFDALVQKPVNFDCLLKKIDELIENTKKR